MAEVIGFTTSIEAEPTRKRPLDLSAMPAYKLKKKEDDVDSLRVDEHLMC